MQAAGKCGSAAGITQAIIAAAAAMLLLAGCDRIFQQRSKLALDTAEKKYADGDYKGALRYYEDALDGTPDTAGVHYKMALLFDEKMKNPLAATYHFQRYLELEPAGPHAKDAKNFIKEDELKLLTTISHGAMMSQEDAVRLKNDNLTLRKQNVELNALLHSAGKTPAAKTTDAKQGTGAIDPKALPAGFRTYVVQHGDTLASIARKFYKSAARWKDIEDANFNTLNGSAKLKPGMTLIIPH
jgi:LysM repeat protein